MKKLFTLLTAVLSFSAVGISQTYDVSCDTLLRPVDGSTFDAGYVLLTYIRSNKGDTLKGTAGDTVRMTILVDGTAVSTLRRNMSTDFLPGASDTITTGINLGGLAAGSHKICVVAGILGGKMDNDNSNDTACSSFTITLPDLSIDSLAITDPAISGDSVTIGATLKSVVVRVQNNGTSRYTGTLSGQNLVLPMTVTIDGSANNFNVPSTQQNPISIAAGSSVTYTLNIGNLNYTFPSTPKSFDLCVKTSLPNDGNTANDEKCLTGLKTYDPLVSVSSINEESNEFNIAHIHNHIQVEGGIGQGQIEIKVIDLTGKVVAHNSFDSQKDGFYQLDAATLQGLYIVDVLENGVSQKTQKIFIR
jgi:hypothetical protein